MPTETRLLPKFDYLSPTSLDEALRQLKDYNTQAKLLAGGTDLLVKMKQRAASPTVIIDMNNIAGLAFIEVTGNMLRIGGLTRLTQIEESSLIKEKIPALAEAVAVMAATHIRHRATIAGNLCNASPAADTAPPLLVMDASVKLESQHGQRTVPLTDFFLGPEQSTIKPDEILTEVMVPIQDGTSAFVKMGKRKALTLSIVSAAAYTRIENGKFADARVALGAVAPTPIRARQIEEALTGKAATEENIVRAAESVKLDCCPITDVRASAEYRTEMSGVLVKRALGKTGLEPK